MRGNVEIDAEVAALRAALKLQHWHTDKRLYMLHSLDVLLWVAGTAGCKAPSETL